MAKLTVTNAFTYDKKSNKQQQTPLTIKSNVEISNFKPGETKPSAFVQATVTDGKVNIQSNKGNAQSLDLSDEKYSVMLKLAKCSNDKNDSGAGELSWYDLKDANYAKLGLSEKHFEIKKNLSAGILNIYKKVGDKLTTWLHIDFETKAEKKDTKDTNPTNVDKPIKKPVEKHEYDSIINGTSAEPRIKKFGITHYKYNDSKRADLTVVDGRYVHKDCAEAFRKMQAAAKRDGVNLRIVSGYRSLKYQIQVFKRKFGGKYPSDEQMKARLKYSAPSGYSEHHTGLAIDINSIEKGFKKTAKYKWLLQHAKEYCFELSFPENNSQGLEFEPWHWRYVGKRGEYKKVFENARRNDPRYKAEYR